MAAEKNKKNKYKMRKYLWPSQSKFSKLFLFNWIFLTELSFSSFLFSSFFIVLVQKKVVGSVKFFKKG